MQSSLVIIAGCCAISRRDICSLNPAVEKLVSYEKNETQLRVQKLATGERIKIFIPSSFFIIFLCSACGISLEIYGLKCIFNLLELLFFSISRIFFSFFKK